MMKGTHHVEADNHQVEVVTDLAVSLMSHLLVMKGTHQVEVVTHWLEAGTQ